VEKQQLQKVQVGLRPELQHLPQLQLMERILQLLLPLHHHQLLERHFLKVIKK